MVTFEPNDLYATCYSDLPRYCLIEAAVYDRDGFQNFFLDRDDGDGSSLFGNKLTRENGGFGTLDTANPAKVRTIDISSWLRQNTRTFDYVILKLDVERAEYNILEKMIRDRTICRINHLFIEWHWDRVGVPHDRHLRLVRAPWSVDACRFWSGMRRATEIALRPLLHAMIYVSHVYHVSSLRSRRSSTVLKKGNAAEKMSTRKPANTQKAITHQSSRQIL